MRLIWGWGGVGGAAKLVPAAWPLFGALALFSCASSPVPQRPCLSTRKAKTNEKEKEKKEKKKGEKDKEHGIPVSVAPRPLC